MEEGSLERLAGISTWVWESPLTDSNLPGLLAKIAAMGFDAVELPLENEGDFSSGMVLESLAGNGLKPFVVGAMAPGRDLVAADPGFRGKDAGLPVSLHRHGQQHRLAHGLRTFLRPNRPCLADVEGAATRRLRVSCAGISGRSQNGPRKRAWCWASNP